MGKRGPRPKPTELKLLEGNPGKRPLPATRPKVKRANLTLPPREFDDRERAVWKRLAWVCQERGLLDELTYSAFKALVIHTAGFERYTQELRELRAIGDSSDLLTSPKNNYKLPHPLVAMRRQESLMMCRYFLEFGLTPSSRSNVVLSVDAEEDEFTKLLQQAKQLREKREGK